MHNPFRFKDNLLNKAKKIKENFKIPLGSRVKESITGFTGIVTSRTQYLNNCNTYGIKPETLKDGKPQGVEWFDEPQLAIIETLVHKSSRETGGNPEIPKSSIENPN